MDGGDDGGDASGISYGIGADVDIGSNIIISAELLARDGLTSEDDGVDSELNLNTLSIRAAYSF